MWGDWLGDQLTCPTSPDNASRYPQKVYCACFLLFCRIICMSIFILFIFCLYLNFHADLFVPIAQASSQRSKPNLRLVEDRDLNWNLRFKVFVHTNG